MGRVLTESAVSQGRPKESGSDQRGRLRRLNEEGNSDKQRIRDLGDTVTSLEVKCEELQRLLDTEVILRTRPGDPGEALAMLRPDVTCQVRLTLLNM